MPRKKPFSHKQKKQQLQEKRIRKGKKDDSESETEESTLNSELCPPEATITTTGIPPTLGVGEGGVVSKYNPKRYSLQFEKEPEVEVERRKRIAKSAIITSIPEVQLEVGVEEVYQPGSVLDIPRRPAWNYSMSKVELEGKEERVFKAYLEDIYSKHTPRKLSYFEHNLETWRQLWRVLEISDVILLITDIRHPALHFSPALYKYVVTELKKGLVLVLNKVDLVPPQVGVAWRHYFSSRFPELKVVCFTSYPDHSSAIQSAEKIKLRLGHRRGRLPSAVGPRELLKRVEEMYRGRVDLKEWRQKLDKEEEEGVLEDVDTPTFGGSPTEHEQEYPSSSEEDEGDKCMDTPVNISPLEPQDETHEFILTIGMVGHPNVGKSSLINGLMAKKLVSTSRTPGHTKHFQTLFLTPTIRLCDCPGLVFPSLVDKQLQILSGIYPIAQVREPYTVVGYLAQRTPIVKLLNLVHPNDVHPVTKASKGKKYGKVPTSGHVTNPERKWTAWDICDAWAIYRGYFTSGAARPDSYRAANQILRLAVDGKISMYFVPPGYTEEKLKWERHCEVTDMRQLQQAGMQGDFPVQEGEERPIFTDPEHTISTEKKSNKFSTLMDLQDSDM